MLYTVKDSQAKENEHEETSPSREFKLSIVRQLTSGEKRLAQVCREHQLASSMVERPLPGIRRWLTASRNWNASVDGWRWKRQQIGSGSPMRAVSVRMEYLRKAGEDESKSPLGCWLTWRRKPKGTVACQ